MSKLVNWALPCRANVLSEGHARTIIMFANQNKNYENMRRWTFTIAGTWYHDNILCKQIPTNDCNLK